MARDDRRREQGKAAALQNVQSLIEFLQRYAPFDQMQPDQLELLVQHSRLAFYAEGEQILAPEDGLVQALYIVKQGRIRGERPGSDGVVTLELHEGEVFPIGALLGERPTRTVYRAGTDCFCLELERESFAELFRDSEPLRDFCLRGISSLLDQVNQQIKAYAADRLRANDSLDNPLAELLRREPVTCAPEASIRTAVARMHERNVGSIVATDADQRPLGIFTLHDLRRIIAEGATDLERPIQTVMTPQPSSLPPSAYAFDAAVLMANHQFRHVCVVEHGRLLGVVSERDLFALQRVNLVNLTRTITRAGSAEELAGVRPQIRGLIDTMLAHGAAAEQINHIITSLNDRIVTRCLELCLAEYGDPGIPFTWIAFGSEGRQEQTLHTDQDNGILFAPPPGMDAEQGRQRLLPLARRINETLAQVGFSWCKGNVMASNPELCLTEAEWHARFSAMITQSTPDNLLRSSIYFDLRPIWGPFEPVQQLYEAVVQEASSHSLFQHMMASNALRNRPPLGLVRDFVTRGDHLDLKLQGLTPFVDAARILALAHGIVATGTLERFQALGERQIVRERDIRAWRDAYGFVQILRMRLHQGQAARGAELSNRLDPDSLNELDRRILKEAFRQARSLQRRLEVDFQVRS